jgi:iron complex outermembrane receptor protein
MTTTRELALAVKRALATGTMALCSAGALAANAQQANTALPDATQMTAAKTVAQKSAPTNGSTTKAPILLAQATPLPASTSSSTAPPPELATVVVTGSLIARPAAETAEAITIVKADSIRSQGITNLEQAVDQLTANVPAAVNVAQSVGQFTGGGTFANLRDLGIDRTLILLDGQRLADNVTLGGAVDLSGIPFAAIESVQVLREGASSLYGSDAIAGVINFITKKNFQGGEVNLNLNHPQESGGASGEADFTFGHGDLASDGYNLMVTGTYSSQRELRATQRSFAATGYAPERGLANLNGPFAPWPGSFQDDDGNLWQVGYPACAGNPYLTTAPGYCAYEYSAAVDLVPKQSVASGLVDFTKALPANNTLHLQYLYTRSKVTDFAGPINYAFPMTSAADPAYYPTGAGATCIGTCSAATPDVADPITAFWTDPNNNRFNDNINTEQRVLLTFSGGNAGWTYAANLNYSENRSAVDTVGGYPNEALLAPGGILSNLINPFGPQSTAGQQFINSTYLNGEYAAGKLQRSSFDANATHALGDAFDAGEPAVLAVGAEADYSKINFASTPLAATLFNALFYPPTSITGSRHSEAVYVELNVPISKSVALDVSDREDKYSDFGETNNGKVSIRYQPFKHVTFRAAASSGFRAPTLVDLYSPNTFGATAGTIGTNNPACLSGNFNSEFSQLVCQSQGLGLYGGNPKLQPETSENFDIGVIVEPIANLGITLDYYRILLKDSLGAIPDSAIYGNPTQFANQYVLSSTGMLTTAPQGPLQCTPSYTVPTCGYILQTTQNTGGRTTDGFDLSVQYLMRTAVGTFRTDLEGTLITHYRLQQYTGGPQLDLLGWFNQGNQPAIHWQHNLALNWTSPGGIWGAGITNRFLSPYIDQFPDGAGKQRKVASQSDWDIYTSFEPIRPMTVLFGIRNVLNTNPPFSNQTQNFIAGYNPIFSDPLLRTFYVDLKYQF